MVFSLMGKRQMGAKVGPLTRFFKLGNLNDK